MGKGGAITSSQGLVHGRPLFPLGHIMFKTRPRDKVSDIYKQKVFLKSGNFKSIADFRSKQRAKHPAKGRATL